MSPERWHNGHSLLGATAENVTCSETWIEGATALTEDMRSYSDADDDQAFADAGAEDMTLAEENAWLASDEAPTMRAHVNAILRDDPPQENSDVGYFIEDHDMRLICFWLINAACDHE